MATLTGTMTLNSVPLPTVCDAVYLLTDQDLGDGPDAAAVTYEASLDGTTWAAVTPGQITALGHTGETLSVRVTLDLDDQSEEIGVVRWIVAYATEGDA